MLGLESYLMIDCFHTIHPVELGIILDEAQIVSAMFGWVLIIYWNVFSERWLQQSVAINLFVPGTALSPGSVSSNGSSAIRKTWWSASDTGGFDTQEYQSVYRREKFTPKRAIYCKKFGVVHGIGFAEGLVFCL